MGQGEAAGALPDGLLPEGAPPELVAFATCTSDEVLLDVTDLGWLPPPGGVDAAAPDVEVRPGPRPGSYEVTAVWLEIVRVQLVVEVVDGVLTVDTSELPTPMARDVERWLQRLDEHLEANGKELDELGFNGRQARLRKVTRREPVLPPGASITDYLEDDGGDVAIGVTFGADAVEARRRARVRWVAGVASAVFIGVLVTTMLMRDDGDGEPVSSVPEASPAPAPGDPPVTDPPTETTAAPDQVGLRLDELDAEGLLASLDDEPLRWPGWQVTDPVGDVSGEGGAVAAYDGGDADVVRVIRPEERFAASVVEDLGCGEVDGALVVCGAEPVADVDHVATVLRLGGAAASGDAAFYQYVVGFRATEDPADDLRADGVLDGVDAWMLAARAGGPDGTFSLQLLTGPAGVPAPTSARLVVAGDLLVLLQPESALTMGELRVGALAFGPDGPPPLGFDVLPDEGFADPALG